ncbi:MAG: hypothetical protein IKI45_14465 [Oscillospiraceae bacterium]|nr:hypothetical protein [Oscillospiraceae bacterium]
MYKLLARKLLGDHYSSALKTVLIAAIMGFGLHGSGLVLPLAQSVLIITAVCFTGTIVMQTLSSKDNARCLRGLFAMPHDDRKCLWAYAAAIGAYVLLTKASILIALLFAFVKLSPSDIVIFILSFVYALFGGFAAFGVFRRMPAVSLLLAAVPIVIAILLQQPVPAITVLAVADVAVILLFSVLHLDDFYVQESAKLKAKHSSKSPKLIVPRYIIRYMLSNKSFLISTLFITGFGCFFAVMTEKQGFPMGCGIGLALVSMNSPLATIVSSSRSLERKLKALPDKTAQFFVPYAAAVFCFDVLVFAVFLTAFSLAGGQIDIRAFIAAGLFAVENAVCTAFLEDRFPITKWKSEPDLWRNPRKYILPLIFVFEAGLIYLT